MIKCRLIAAVEEAERTKEIRFAVYSLAVFLAVAVSLLAEVVG